MMIELRQTAAFRRWRASIKDDCARALIASRLSRLSFGHFGDPVSVGGGVFELRIHYGPGYRIYYGRHGQTLILLFCGGNKSTQIDDIKKARKIAMTWGESDEHPVQ